MRQTIYTVRAGSGITFHIEASSLSEAIRRARDPAISKEISRMIREAVGQVEGVGIHRGPARDKLFFANEFFQ